MNNSQDFRKLDAKDKLSQCLKMLEFITDALLGWSEDALNFTHNHRLGYVIIMDNIREILEKNIAILGEDNE